MALSKTEKVIVTMLSFVMQIVLHLIHYLSPCLSLNDIRLCSSRLYAFILYVFMFSEWKS